MHPLKETLRHSSASVRRKLSEKRVALREYCTNLPQEVGFSDKDRPSGGVVIMSLVYLILFIVTSIFAITKPTHPTRLVVCFINSFLAASLLVMLTFDMLYKSRANEYRRNLANTVMTVLFTIIVMTALYMQIWYHNLNREEIKLSLRNVDYPRFPSVSFFQFGHPSMAVLHDNPLKCYVGEWEDDARMCTGLTVEEFKDTKITSCNCADRWQPLESLENGDARYKWREKENVTVYTMKPSESMYSRGAGSVTHNSMKLQIFFSYNPAESLGNSTVTTTPGAFLAVYDPTWTWQQVEKAGLLEVASVDANGAARVSLGLIRYEYLNKPLIYQYDTSIYNQQNLDLVCNVTRQGWYPCPFHVEISIPFSRETVMKEIKSLSWSGLLAEAGAFFALVQFFSWMISGQAWAR